MKNLRRPGTLNRFFAIYTKTTFDFLFASFTPEPFRSGVCPKIIRRNSLPESKVLCGPKLTGEAKKIFLTESQEGYAFFFFLSKMPQPEQSANKGDKSALEILPDTGGLSYFSFQTKDSVHLSFTRRCLLLMLYFVCKEITTLFIFQNSVPQQHLQD